jgi:rubrerythrin
MDERILTGDSEMKPEDFQLIIKNAIDAEIEAYEFYHGVAEKVQDAPLKRIFSELAAEEKGHRAFLQAILNRDLQAFKVEDSEDYKLAETLDVPPLTLDMKPADGIALAIRKELDAMQMYAQLAQVSSDSGEKSTFLELSQMEKNHKTRLEDIYTNMAFPEVW